MRFSSNPPLFRFCFSPPTKTQLFPFNYWFIFVNKLAVYSPDYLLSSLKIGDWYRMDDYTDNSFDFDGFDDYLNLNWEWKKEDVLDMLPSDPFEMNISGGCTMIRGWIQEVDDDIGYIKISEKSIGDEINLDDTSTTNGLFFFDGSKESKALQHSFNKNTNCCQSDGKDNIHVGVPHDALFFALGHLGMRDLMSVERVCKSLRDGVRNDPLLWRNIHIDQQPGESFADESLLRITNRASGSLQSLSLVKCLKITDNGLKNVIQQNPGLTKLSLLGCNGLTMEGLLSNLKSLKTTNGGGIKRLRIGGLHSITMEQFEDLKKVLSIDNNNNNNNNKNHLTCPKPRFYNGGQLHLSLEDDRPIDIEACPKCHQLRQVYDCPADTCQGKRYCCRACTFCIPRCINCGCCLNERNYMETFCLDFICFHCLKQILSFTNGGEDEDMGVDSGQSGHYQQASYRFCLYG
ncbi:unnamed protein product [Lactuca virosa]|uniref:F-box domain-containing protein n=1 Tax=Lactuca virosa TaxID=75947 RepID=A0AAU9LMR2_9ASTR|nr:unnamed protein product [Lactuca virosa]